jgi:UDP:flavonoid glycosyltransferase YjiC (YdhE family)
VVAVITHCGWGGFMECIQAGKPILAAPGFADQLANAKTVEEKRIGFILRPESDLGHKA